MVNFALPWATGEPNGKNSENCVVLSLAVGMSDYPCDNPNDAHVCMCERSPAPYLRLRHILGAKALSQSWHCKKWYDPPPLILTKNVTHKNWQLSA